MSRCFHGILPDNNVAFIPEGLFDNMINMEWFWFNTSLSSTSSKTSTRLSSQEPADDPGIIVRIQGRKPNYFDDYLVCSHQFSLNLIPT